MQTGSWVIKLDHCETSKITVSRPEDIFLLDSVRQVVTGVDVFSDKTQTKSDSNKLHYLQFLFKHKADILYVVFEQNEQCLMFIDKLDHIVDSEMD